MDECFEMKLWSVDCWMNASRCMCMSAFSFPATSQPWLSLAATRAGVVRGGWRHSLASRLALPHCAWTLGVLLLEFVTKLDGADDELAGVPAQVFVHMANFEALFKRKRECNCSNIS